MSGATSISCISRSPSSSTTTSAGTVSVPGGGATSTSAISTSTALAATNGTPQLHRVEFLQESNCPSGSGSSPGPWCWTTRPWFNHQTRRSPCRITPAISPTTATIRPSGSLFRMGPYQLHDTPEEFLRVRAIWQRDGRWQRRRGPSVRVCHRDGLLLHHHGPEIDGLET